MSNNIIAKRVGSMIATAVGIGLATWTTTNDLKTIGIAVGLSLVNSYIHLIQPSPQDEGKAQLLQQMQETKTGKDTQQ